MGCPSSREKTMLFYDSSTDTDVTTVYTSPHSYAAHVIIWLCYRLILYIFRNLPTTTIRAIPKKSTCRCKKYGYFRSYKPRCLLV